MNAKEYLNQVREADQKVEWLRRQVANLRRLTTDTSVHLTDMPHSDSPDQQKLLTILAEIDELERQIPIAEKKAESIRQEVGYLICRIHDQTVQDILTFRYMEGQYWKDIAQKTGYSIPHVRRFNAAGLAELNQLLSA